MKKDYRPSDNGPLEDLEEIVHLPLRDQILQPKLILDRKIDDILQELQRSEDPGQELESIIEREK